MRLALVEDGRERSLVLFGARGAVGGGPVGGRRGDACVGYEDIILLCNPYAGRAIHRLPGGRGPRRGEIRERRAGAEARRAVRPLVDRDLVSVAESLAEIEVSIFAIATYDTDYGLVKEEWLELAASTLAERGYVVRR